MPHAMPNPRRENADAQEPTAETTRAPSGSAKRGADYAIYKPNSRGSGGVVRFELNRSKASVFVDAALQMGEKQFDWEQKITMKWGLADLGTVLATLQGRQPQAKLYHQSEKANSAFELTLREDPQRAPYFMTVSRQEESDKKLRKVTIPVSHAEAAILETALRSAVIRLLGW
jgi:hypothetical protein